jgi:hypothetical protein
MPNYIIRFDTPRGARYLEYSTIVDAPVTTGMTRDEFERHYVEQYGLTSVHDMRRRLAVVDKKGTSSMLHATVVETISYNRAGKDESRLTVSQLVDYYVTRQCEGEQPVGTSTRIETQ